MSIGAVIFFVNFFEQVAAAAPFFHTFTHFLKKYVIMFVTKFDFLRLTYERKGGDDKYGLRKAI